ncbi:hypothetical protein MKX34_20555 [Paenibacillus sp. FSL R5-0636]|uniref:hypothetical protein n=1 Tax=unclassified Paenibacillus TaxID=185978 RepID=UPI0030CE2F39
MQQKLSVFHSFHLLAYWRNQSLCGSQDSKSGSERGFWGSMMDGGYFRTQMTLFANISALEQGFGLQCSYSPEKAAFGVFFRPIATMRSVRIPKMGYDASKGHLSPIDASGRANVIEESVTWECDSGREQNLRIR